MNVPTFVGLRVSKVIRRESVDVGVGECQVYFGNCSKAPVSRLCGTPGFWLPRFFIVLQNPVLSSVLCITLNREDQYEKD